MSYSASPSPFAFNLSQIRVFPMSYQVARVLQLQHFQWIFKIGFLKIVWFDVLVVQGILKNPPAPQFKGINSSVLKAVKRMPTMWETWVLSLRQQNPLEKEMATHSSTLAWKLPWIQEPSKLQSVQSQRVGYDWVTSPYLTFPTLLYCQTLISIHDYWKKK